MKKMTTELPFEKNNNSKDDMMIPEGKELAPIKINLRFVLLIIILYTINTILYFHWNFQDKQGRIMENLQKRRSRVRANYEEINIGEIVDEVAKLSNISNIKEKAEEAFEKTLLKIFPNDDNSTNTENVTTTVILSSSDEPEIGGKL